MLRSVGTALPCGTHIRKSHAHLTTVTHPLVPASHVLPQRLRVVARAGPNVSNVPCDFRVATEADRDVIMAGIQRERMNPLNLHLDRFVLSVNANGEVLGFVQIVEVAHKSDPIWELRSLIVQPEYRGRGIGAALVREVLRRAGDSDVYLTTIARRMSFYEPFGFQPLQLSQVPRWLLFEVIMGKIVTALLFNTTVNAMLRPAAAAKAKTQTT